MRPQYLQRVVIVGAILTLAVCLILTILRLGKEGVSATREARQQASMQSLTSPPSGAGSIPKGEHSLAKYQTDDTVLKRAANEVRALVSGLECCRLTGEVDLLVVDYPVQWEKQIDKKYYTENCKALVHGVTRPLVVCNAKLFYEIEAVIRSVLISPSCFAKDESLFALVRSIQPEPYSYLQGKRRQTAAEIPMSVLNDQVEKQMKLILLFFVGHEIGHIKDGLSGRSFISQLSPDAPLEHRVEEAVVRMGRHVEEFNQLGFKLPGFPSTIDVGSEIRSPEMQFRKNLQEVYRNNLQWYQDEVSADSFANSVILEHLASLDKTDKIIALEEQHLLISTLFFSAVYHWYKDLEWFASHLDDGPLTNSRELVVSMMKDRQQYIKAASMFGDTHRFSLLRSLLAIEKILEKRTDFFTSTGRKTIWCTEEELQALDKKQRMLKVWHHSNLQKYSLLCVLMDTPVKLANVGAITGWLKEVDKKRGTPQLFIMNFETMEEATQRMFELP
jgi:hypothetical protein